MQEPDIYVSPLGYVMFISFTPTTKDNATTVTMHVESETVLQPWVAEEIDPVAFKDLQ